MAEKSSRSPYVVDTEAPTSYVIVTRYAPPTGQIVVNVYGTFGTRYEAQREIKRMQEAMPAMDQNYFEGYARKRHELVRREG